MSHAQLSVRRISLAIAAALLFALVALFPAAAQANADRGHHGRGKVVGVMTRNLYLGADLLPALSATSLEGFVAASGQILREVTANDFPVRARGLAHEILKEKPDLVGLQEVALWRTGPVDFEVLSKGPSATHVRYDYLRELLAQLNRHGPRYRLVFAQNEADIEAPADEDGNPATGPYGADLNARLTMRDAILARRGAGVRTIHPDAGHFAHLLPVEILGTQFPITRGWVSTDAKVRGSHWFRFVDTHLEAYGPGTLRAAQAQELVAPGGPATSSLPVVLVGDLNSDDDTVAGEDRLAYEALLAAGMVERSTNEPLGCCLNSSLLGVKAAEEAGAGIADFNHQVDHVMTRNPSQISLVSSAVTGLLPVHGFWDSDHAGLFSALRFVR